MPNRPEVDFSPLRTIWLKVTKQMVLYQARRTNLKNAFQSRKDFSMKNISIIGMPMDLGALRRGVDMGPYAIRAAQITHQLKSLGHQVFDEGNIFVPFPENIVETPYLGAKYLHEISIANKALCEMVYQVLSEGKTPLVLGGDHSLGIGSVAGTSRFFRERNKIMGLIWLDAHADINTPSTSTSYNIHGMPVAHILGLGAKELNSLSGPVPMVDPKNTVLLGVRDVDEAEKANIHQTGVKVFTMQDIDQRGLNAVMEEALNHLNHCDCLHVSFDVDWIDPFVAPGVGTPVPGGATYREGHLAMEKLCDTKKVIALDIAEVNPILDHANQTAIMATLMALSLFGKKIV